MGGVLVVAAGNHHGIHIGLVKQLPVTGILERVAAEPAFAHSSGFFTGHPPGVAHGGDLHILGFRIVFYRRHDGAFHAASTADQADGEPVIRSGRFGIAEGTQGCRRACGRFQEFAS